LRLSQAIILAAGAGSRLRDVAPSKPLCPVAGRPLIDHALDRLALAGIGRVIVVTGYEADAIEAHLAAGDHDGLAVEVVRSPDWRRPNGVSALAAAAATGGRDSLLLMADHLVDPALYRLLASAGAGGGLRLGVDRRLDHPWVDLDDVTRVRTEGNRIVAIGKHLDDYDAFDSGVFAVGPALFEALAALPDPSLSEAVSRLAQAGRAEVVDIGTIDWIDVDDPRALAMAEDWIGSTQAR